MSDTILKTRRLTLRRLNANDAPFILRLLNEPSFIENIADRGVRTVADAVGYIEQGPQAMYAEHGVGLWLVARTADDTPIGMCGLLKRPTLDDLDIGYALIPEACGQGFAHEACEGTLAYASDTLGLSRVVAIVSAKNEASIGLLKKLGFVFETETVSGDPPHSVLLFGKQLG